MLLCAWAGEEKGLLGSRYYVSHAAFPLNRTVAMFQLDMIGRPTREDRVGPAVVALVEGDPGAHDASVGVGLGLYYADFIARGGSG